MPGSKNKQQNRSKIVLTGEVPKPAPHLRTGSIPQRRKFTFGFLHWREIKYFGIDQVEKSWLLSLLFRLQDLCSYDIEEIVNSSGRALAGAIRFHPINWEQDSIPISKSDLPWVSDLLGEPEFEIYQFHISRALGRVVGFIDQNNVFQIVLLDPMHNIQPSKDFNYRVRDTHISECELTKLKSRYERQILGTPYLDGDQRLEIIDAIERDTIEVTGHAIALGVSSATLGEISTMVCSGLAESVEGILQIGIDEVKKMLAKEE